MVLVCNFPLTKLASFLVCHISSKKVTYFLGCLKVMLQVFLDYSKDEVLFRYVFNLCFRYVLKNDISKAY